MVKMATGEVHRSARRRLVGRRTRLRS